MLEKVCNFLKRIGYDLKVEQIKNILVNVPIVNKAIKTLVNKYIEIINNGEMDRISEIPLILMFLEVYCDEHDIKTIPDDRVEIESAYIDKDLHSKVYELLDKCNLSANEKEVLVLRFGLNGKEGLTLEATGKTLSLTKERIRQIEAKALHKLRKAKYIKEFAIYMNKPSRAIEYIDDSRRLGKAAIVEDQNIEIEVIALEDISTDLLPNLREILESLTAKKQKALLLYLGYYKGKRLTNKEKSRYLNISESFYSSKIKEIIEELKVFCKDIDLDEVFQDVRKRNGERVLNLKIKKKVGTKMIEKLKELIATLPERQRKVINLHLGFYEGPRLKLTDKCVMAELSQPTFSKTVIEVLKKLAQEFPEIENFEEEINKTRLQNGEKVRGINNSKISLSTEKTSTLPMEPEKIKMAETPKITEGEKPATSIVENEKTTVPIVEEHPDLTITHNADKQAEVVTKLNSTLKAPSFKELMSDMSAKEAIIISLRYGEIFGYLGRNYSIEEISRILEIDSEEVIRTCRKVLFYFKDELDSFLNTLLNENNPTR